MNKSGGGSATNAGIDYQQRVSALFLISLYSQFDISQLLNIKDELIIESVSYETDSTVDDLNVFCEGNKVLYMQIKRKIALSEKDGTEFQKVLEQFLLQYISNPKKSNRFFLVTTSDTSKNIKYDLRKILDSIRLNDTGFRHNPLNIQEKKTFSALEVVFNRSYKKLRSNNPSDKDFTEFCKQVFVSIIDVESDMTTEKIAIMLLHSQKISMPSLVWNYLVSQGLYYSANRLSINFDGINETLDKFSANKTSKSDIENQLNELLKPITTNSSQLSTGKDVFIVESFIDDYDYAIVELFRFNDDGEKRVKFEDDSVLLAQGTTKAKVIRRFSTTVGLSRYMEENFDYYKDKKIVILETKDIDKVEETEAAIKYKEYCNDMLRKNNNLINCVHSGKSCLSVPSYFIEVDCPNYPPAIGMVREEYLMPLDRILGKPLIPKENAHFPTEINIAEWISLLHKGQGLVKSLPNFRRATEDKVLIIGWNQENQQYAEYNYCIRNILSDGSTTYLYARGKIQRFPKCESEEQAEYLNSQILQDNNADDPFCMSSETWAVGPRSLVSKMIEDGEDILEVERVEVCQYSKLLSELYDRHDNYYAPLCFVIHKHTEQIFVIGNIVPLISNPFDVRMFFNNWEEAGFSCADYSLSVIHNDFEFDKHMKDIIKDDLVPVIDPKFTTKPELEEGVVVKELDRLIKERKDAQPAH